MMEPIQNNEETAEKFLEAKNKRKTPNHPIDGASFLSLIINGATKLIEGEKM